MFKNLSKLINLQGWDNNLDVEWLSTFDQKPRCMSFSYLGNVHILDDDSNRNIKFNAQVTFGGEHNLGPAIANTFITFNGELCWSVSYFPPVTDKQLPQKYIDRSLEILMHECEKKKKIIKIYLHEYKLKSFRFIFRIH